jgi:hypothetical protein
MVSTGLRAAAPSGDMVPRHQKGTTMSTSTVKRTSVQSLEDAFLRRMEYKKDDAGAAVLAEELFQEVSTSTDQNRISEAYFQLTAVGLKAMFLWEVLPKEGFLKTRKVIWKAVIEGWLSFKTDAVELVQFRQFIRKHFDSNNDYMLAYIKEQMDANAKNTAFQEVMAFWAETDLENVAGLTEAFSRMFGRYTRNELLKLVAPIFSALECKYNEPNRDPQHPHIMDVLGEHLAWVATTFLPIARVAAELRQAPFTKEAEMLLVSTDLLEIKFEQTFDKDLRRENATQRALMALEDVQRDLKEWKQKHDHLTQVTVRLVMKTNTPNQTLHDGFEVEP